MHKRFYVFSADLQRLYDGEELFGEETSPLKNFGKPQRRVGPGVPQQFFVILGVIQLEKVRHTFDIFG